MAGRFPPAVKSQALLLHPDDTVLICIQPIAEGDPLEIDGVSIPAPQSVAVGHKLARRMLGTGDKVLKHGAPIGSITQQAAPGEHVHAHNMQSDYIQSHTREMKTHTRKTQNHSNRESGGHYV